MKKLAILAVILGLAGCDEFNPTLQTEFQGWVYGGEVNVKGRTWLITRKAENVNSVRAERDSDLNPFGGPSVRKSIQATQAIEKATGCKIIKGTLYKNVSDVFYADVLCKYRTES
jgi:hypothetical protein